MLVDHDFGNEFSFFTMFQWDEDIKNRLKSVLLSLKI